MKLMKILGLFLGGFAILALIVMIIAYPFMWLWNWLMPTVFGLGTISFWQSLGILAFLSIIGSFFKRSSSK